MRLQWLCLTHVQVRVQRGETVLKDGGAQLAAKLKEYEETLIRKEEEVRGRAWTYEDEHGVIKVK